MRKKGEVIHRTDDDPKPPIIKKKEGPIRISLSLTMT